MYKIFLLLILASAGASGASLPLAEAGTTAPDHPSAFTDYLIKSVVSRYRADQLKPDRTTSDIAYLSGKVDGTIAQAKIVGRNPSWMTRFGTKMRVEQVLMEPEEQQIVISVLFGTSPKTDRSQYWQGYEDAIQETLDSMNSWPGTGGRVIGTTIEYSIVLPAAVN